MNNAVNLTPARLAALKKLAASGPLGVYDFPSYGRVLQGLLDFGFVRLTDDRLYEITDTGREAATD